MKLEILIPPKYETDITDKLGSLIYKKHKVDFYRDRYVSSESKDGKAFTYTDGFDLKYFNNGIETNINELPPTISVAMCEQAVKLKWIKHN